MLLLGLELCLCADGGTLGAQHTYGVTCYEGYYCDYYEVHEGLEG